MTSNVVKRCACGAAKWPKCAEPWYLKQFRYQGSPFAPNLTRYAADVLQPPRELKTKTDAEAVALIVIAAIKNGTYVSAKTKKNAPPEKPKTDARVSMTTAIAKFCKDVIDGDIKKRPQTKTGNKHDLAAFAAFTVERGDRTFAIGELPVDAVIVKDAIDFRRSAKIRVLANSSWAKYRTTIAQFFTWAKREGFTTSSPFDALVTHEKEALARGEFRRRKRRVSHDEQAALVKAAGRTRADDATADRLQAIIIAAIECAMRLGELLALQWGDVHLYTTPRRIYVRAEEVGGSKTGASNAHDAPISEKLFALLVSMLLDPNGKEWPRDAYVFGDAVGGRVKSIKKAWATLVLRAYGFEPAWDGTKLTAKSRAQLDRIDLEFKDLRRECALRWYESRVFDILEIRDALGHTSVETTQIYLNVPATSPADAMQRFDEKRARDEQHARRQQLTVVAGSAVPEDVSSAHKLHTNQKSVRGAVDAPRLVKGGKRRSGV